MKKIPLLLLNTFIVITSCYLTSCSNKDDNSEIAIKSNISLLNDIEFDYANSFFDDFSNGVDSDNWYIGKQAWGTGNGGVIPENVKYTDDGILELRGTGLYYSGDDIRGVGDVKDGRMTGAALISKFLTTPGRYETKIKVLPRIGACSAFWTFAYQFNSTGDLNNEIDIELPGGIHSTSTPSFENILNTNYVTESLKISKDTYLGDITGSNFAFNDGNWHVVGFDWYTNPEKIVYYVDGVVVAINDLFVPSLQTRLWLGVWFPSSGGFVGTANFEEDVMQVDYVKYIPFKDQPYEKFTPVVNGVAIEQEYPQTSSSHYLSNFISNGNFEYAKNYDIENKGWLFNRYINETKEISEVTGIAKGLGYEDSYGVYVKDNGVVEQIIDAAYEGFKYKLSFNSKIEGTKGYVSVEYLGSLSTDVISRKSLTITSDKWETYNMDLECPQGCKQVRIVIDTIDGSTIYVDNVSMVR